MSEEVSHVKFRGLHHEQRHGSAVAVIMARRFYRSSDRLPGIIMPIGFGDAVYQLFLLAWRARAGYEGSMTDYAA
jgi:hypothetical protein